VSASLASPLLLVTAESSQRYAAPIRTAILLKSTPYQSRLAPLLAMRTVTFETEIKRTPDRQHQLGRSAEIVPESPLKDSWRATVKVVDRVVDSASGSFGVRLELANPNGEIPAGVKCRVRFL